MKDIEAALQGRVGSDPGVRTAKSGKTYVRFSVAVGEGNAIQWVQVTAFEKQVDRVVATVRKGDRVYAEGRIRLDRWQKDGAERSGLGLAAWRVQALGQIGERKPKQQNTAQAAPEPAKAGGYDFGVPAEEVEIPF